jgi:hypothetical protein
MNFHDPDALTRAARSRWFNVNARAILKRVINDDFVLQLMPPGQPGGALLMKFTPEQKPNLGQIVKAPKHHSLFWTTFASRSQENALSSPPALWRRR